MHKVALILGSNISDGRDYLTESKELIVDKVGLITAASSVYSSPPWGYQSANVYNNQVVVIETMLEPLDVLSTILNIETSLGRVRSQITIGYEDRTIDIDILLIDQLIINLPHLVVPHPRMHLRKFCLLPMLEVAPSWNVSTFDKTIEELLSICEDASEISLI